MDAIALGVRPYIYYAGLDFINSVLGAEAAAPLGEYSLYLLRHCFGSIDCGTVATRAMRSYRRGDLPKLSIFSKYLQKKKEVDTATSNDVLHCRAKSSLLSPMIAVGLKGCW